MSVWALPLLSTHKQSGVRALNWFVVFPTSCSLRYEYALAFINYIQ